MAMGFKPSSTQFHKTGSSPMQPEIRPQRPSRLRIPQEQSSDGQSLSLPLIETTARSAAHREDLVQDLPASENKRFYPALDGLRALAVLMVFVQHYGGFLVPPSITYGWAGVDFFFVLSGFLITGILYDTRNSVHRFRNFYVRRTLRIFPLYYGVLLLALLLDPIFRWAWHPAWYLWPIYLGNYARFWYLGDFVRDPVVVEHLRAQAHFASHFVARLGHFWSLGVEEQFYFVWPFVVFYIKDRKVLRNLCAAVFVLALLARIVCELTLPASLLQVEFLYRFTPLRVDALLLGGFLALALRGPEIGLIAKFARPVVVGVFVIFCFLQGLDFLVYRSFFPASGTAPGMNTIGFSLIDLLAGALLLLAIDSKTFVYRLLSGKQLRRLGQMSYGFYVFHDIPHDAYYRLAHLVVGDHGGRLILGCAVIAFFGTLTLSYLSFRFYEAPFLRLKDRFTD
jgi:peptidoglycan/LPS O-acetylase OafA/YrhL